MRRRPDRVVEVSIRTQDPVVRAQSALMGMVVENLLTNADKYSPLEKPIQILVQSCDGRIALQIQDQGIGIRESDLPKLFTPFYRTDNARGYASGMGLGLAVCKRIVEAYGGTISAESPPEGGTRFVLSLPSG